MARRQNKSLKVNKKDSSISVNNKKSGKVQKNISERKAKKVVESKIKQVVKTSHNKNQVKQDSPVKIGRKSGRINPEVTKKSSPIVSRRAVVDKVSTSTRASVSSKITGKLHSPSKKKSSPVIEPRNKKLTSATKAQKLKKDETAGLKRGDTKMNLRGKKRSYAQMASGNESLEETLSKKKKTAEPKNITSRRSRSIKPTAKVAEWRSVILQKKSNIQQDKSHQKSEKPSSIKCLPQTASKSPQAKTPKKTQVSPAKKSTPRKSGGRRSAVKIQNPPPTKNKVKNVKNISSAVKQTPNARRNRNRKSISPQSTKNNSSKPNTLAASIKNKFNSCITSKRKSKDTKLQENVVVAQGILHDILYSVVNNDISILNEESDKESKSTKTVKASDSQVSRVSQLDTIDHNVLCDSKQVNVPSKTESNSDVSNELIEKEKGVVNINLDCNSKISDNGEKISVNKSNNEKNESVVNESMEDMELHLSDTSSTYSNNDMVSSEVSKTKSAFDPEQSSEISNVGENSLKNESELNVTMETEDKLHCQTPLSNNNDSSDSTVFDNGTKESSPLVTDAESLQKKNTEKDLSLNTNVSLSQSEVSSNTLEVTENVNSTSTSELICSKLIGSGTGLKGLCESSSNRLNDESDFNDVNITIKTLGGDKKEKMATEISNVGKDDAINSFEGEMKSDSDTNFDGQKMYFTNGKSIVSNLSEVNESPKKDNFITSLDKSQNGQISQTEIENNKLMNGDGQSNGLIDRDEKIKPEVTLDLEKIQENDIVTVNVNLENSVCLKSNVIKPKKDSDLEDQKSESLSKDKETSGSEPRCQTETNLEKSQDIDLNSYNTSDKQKIPEKLPPGLLNLSSSVKEENDISNVSSDCKTVAEERLPLIPETEISAAKKLGDPTTNVKIAHCHLDSSDSSKLICKETIAKNIGKETANVSQIVAKDELESGDSTKKGFIIESSSAKLTEEVLDNTCSSKIKNSIDSNVKTDLKNEKVSSDNSSSSLRMEQISVGENCSSEDSHIDTNVSLENQLGNTEVRSQTDEHFHKSSEGSTVTNKDKEPTEEVLKMEEENQEITQDEIIVDETDGESMQCSSGTLSNRMSVDEENTGMEVDSENLGTIGNACSTIEINMEVS